MYSEENSGGMLVNKVYCNDECKSLVCTLRIMEEKQLCLVSFNDSRTGKKEYNSVSIYRMLKKGITDKEIEQSIKAGYDIVKNNHSEDEEDFYTISDKAIDMIVSSLCDDDDVKE